MNIDEIRALKEAKVKKFAIEMMDIKGHQVYFAHLGDTFGYSYLVFKNEHHIHYANDYELHHGYIVKQGGIAALKQYYIEQSNNKLFTEEELVGPIKSYDEYQAKSHYLHNYYGMQVDYISRFVILHNEEEEKDYDEKVKNLFYNPVSFSYMADKEFVAKMVQLQVKLTEALEATKEDYEYQKSAFLYEMYNHEYLYAMDPDWSTLQAFGRVSYAHTTLDGYFDELGFNEIQRKAYRDARDEVLASA